MSQNLPCEEFPPEIEKRGRLNIATGPAKRQNRPPVLFSEKCGENDVFEDSEFGHMEHFSHFEKLFVFFCHLFLLCLAASYERIDAETAAFKLSVLPDMGM